MEGREKPQVGLEAMWGWGKGGGGGLAPARKYNLQGGALFAIFFGARYLIFLSRWSPIKPKYMNK